MVLPRSSDLRESRLPRNGSGCVTLADGRVLALASLPARVPTTCFAGGLHIELCHRIARRSGFCGEDGPPAAGALEVYVNLLAIHSRVVREITALLHLTRRHRLLVRRIASPFFGEELRDLLGEATAEAIEIASLPRRFDYLNRSKQLSFGLKIATHRLYRALGRRVDYTRVIRAYCDTSDRTYESELGTATLLLYPFRTSLQRHLRYLRLCWREGRRASLTGLPYRWRDLRVLVSPDCDRALVECEIAAQREHARELALRGVRELFASDEWDAPSWIFHGELAARGVRSVNTSHGVGVYGPYVRCGHFVFYNDRQRELYAPFARYDSSALRGESTRPVPNTPAPGAAASVVFLQGNWKRMDKGYEAHLEGLGLRRTRDYCAAEGVPFAIKVHPNLSDTEIETLSRELGAPALRRFSLEEHPRPIFVNTLSTAYYDFRADGPTLFLEDELLKPQALFGDAVRSTTIEGLGAELTKLLDPDAWAAALRQQLEPRR